MTTIAYKEGRLAADSQITQGGCIYHREDKIYQAAGCLITGCGHNRTVENVAAWIADVGPEWVSGEGCPDIPERDDYHTLIIVVEAAGCVYEIGPDGIDIVTRAGGLAWGSGFQIAYGAMAAGATALEAVRYASDFDIYSSGPFTEYAVKPDRSGFIQIAGLPL